MLSCNPLAACIAVMMKAKVNQTTEANEGTTMTNAIEQSKREMYLRQLEMLNDPYIDGIREKCYRLNDKKFRKYESAVESYLELLRQDHEALHETARKRFEDLQVDEADNEDMGIRLAKMTEERDAIQLRLHAVDHAYKTHQGQAGTSGQTSGDRATCEAAEGQKAAIQGALADIRRISDDWALNGVRAKKSMLKISGILARPEVYASMEVQECQHSFHPCPLSRDDKSEVCVFCGEVKLECDHRWGSSDSDKCTKCGAPCPL